MRVDQLFCTNQYKLSDAKTKENIHELPAKALNIVRNMRIYEYMYKKEYGGNGSKDVGFIAQQLQAICPQLVHEHVCWVCADVYVILCTRV
jgi:hypothetical protein